MSSQFENSSRIPKSGPFGPLRSPSPLDYPYRQFLPLGEYTEESIRSYLSSPFQKDRCAYRTKVRDDFSLLERRSAEAVGLITRSLLQKLEGKERKVIVLYTNTELKEVCVKLARGLLAAKRDPSLMVDEGGTGGHQRGTGERKCKKRKELTFFVQDDLDEMMIGS